MAIPVAKNVALGGTLAAGCALLYSPATQHAFLNFDDDFYVVDNPWIASGLTPDALRWAFTTDFGGNWFPLTWLSYLVDAELHGLSASGVHAVNVGLHALVAAFAFAALFRLTRDYWPSAFVAAVFAFHPLQVEVVAWAAQRRAILAGLFWMLSLWTYARAFGPEADGKGLKGGRTWWLGFWVVCGLMSKPSFVTLPFVLLLLDFWPLRRLGAPGSRRWVEADRFRECVVEKLPLFGLVAVVSLVTLVAQQDAGAVASVGQVSVAQRFINIPIAYVGYLENFFWPTGLAVYYPYINQPGTGLIIASLLSVLGLTAAALASLRRFPHLAVGWFWFLGALVPMIGLVQVGSQALADRYAYVATMGISIAIAWSVPSRVLASAPARAAFASASVIVILGLALGTRAQLSHWRDSTTLFSHTVAVTGPNVRAQERLGAALLDQGKARAALKPLRQAVAISPEDAPALMNLSKALLAARGGAPSRREALEVAQRAASLTPGDGVALETLAEALATHGRSAEAAQAMTRALELVDAKRQPRRARALAHRIRGWEQAARLR